MPDCRFVALLRGALPSCMRFWLPQFTATVATYPEFFQT
jgi:hypothetical protein